MTESIDTVYWWKTGATYIKMYKAQFLIFMRPRVYFVLFCLEQEKDQEQGPDPMHDKARAEKQQPAWENPRGTVQTVSVLIEI